MGLYKSTYSFIIHSVCLSVCQADDNQNKADRLYELKMRELDERACELQHAEEDCRRAINEATKKYNLAQVFILHYQDAQDKDDWRERIKRG